MPDTKPRKFNTDKFWFFVVMCIYTFGLIIGAILQHKGM